MRQYALAFCSLYKSHGYIVSHALINPRELDVEVEVGTSADEVHDGPAVKDAVGTTVVEVEEGTAIEVQHGNVRHVCSLRRARFTTNLSIYFVISKYSYVYKFSIEYVIVFF